MNEFVCTKCGYKSNEESDFLVLEKTNKTICTDCYTNMEMNKEPLTKKGLFFIILQEFHNYIDSKNRGSLPDLCDSHNASYIADKETKEFEKRLKKNPRIKNMWCTECKHKIACNKTDEACLHFQEIDCHSGN